MSIEKAENKQSSFATELKNFDKGIKILEKNSFYNNLELLFSAREKVLNSFKSRLFPIKNLDKISTREPTPKPEVAKEPATELEVATEPAKAAKAKIKCKIFSLKFSEEFLNKIKYNK